MKYERIAKGANGRRWKITHELLDGPQPKAKKARPARERTAKPSGRKPKAKKGTSRASKAPRDAKTRSRPPTKATSSQRRAKRASGHRAKPEQLRFILLS